MSAEVRKISSNVTNFRLAREDSTGDLPAEPIWFDMEPNSYPDFGGDVKTVARAPINAKRTRRKGTAVDLDATAGFQQDLTQEGLSHLWEGVFMSVKRRKPFHGMNVPYAEELAAVASDGTSPAFHVGTGEGSRYAVGDLVWSQGWASSGNNGLKKVTAVTGDYVRAAGLANETAPDGAYIRLVGHEFTDTEASIDATANELPQFKVNAAYAAGTLTLSGNVSADDTVTIGGQTYTFKGSVTTTANQVKVGADASASLDNLIAAINGAAGGGTVYGSATVANAYVTAAAGSGDTMDVTAKHPGAAGNSIATTEVSSNGAWGGATLSGGSGTGLDHFVLLPGEWIFIGGDQTAEKFSAAECNGFARVFSNVSDLAIKLDKTSGGADGITEMADNAGTGKTIRVFFGDMTKNESALSAYFDTVTYRAERTLGKPNPVSDPDQVQSEYVTRCAANVTTFNVKQADKVTVDFAFVGADNFQRDGTVGEEVLSETTGSIWTPELSDAMNTTNDFSRLKMSLVPPTSGSAEVETAPLPLFGLITEGTFTFNNNVTADKAVTVMGGFDITIGTFEVNGSLTAYFSEVAALQAIRQNKDVTIDWIAVKDWTNGRKAGFVMDIPLLALGNGRLGVELNKAITLPLSMSDGEYQPFGHSAAFMEFWYLPAAADV